MNLFNICSAISKSAITPSFMGRTAMMLPGVRPNIRFASVPTASTRPDFFSTATTEGSLSTIPFPCTYTRDDAVPRSMARSFENHPKISLPKPTIVLPSLLDSNGVLSQVTPADPHPTPGYRQPRHQDVAPARFRESTPLRTL